MSRSTSPTGSLTAIIGPNGAGKTTFFNLISGALRPDRGRVKLAGEDIAGLSPTADRAARHRARVPDRQHLSVADGGSDPHGAVQAHMGHAERIMRRFPLPECRDRADEVMTMLGLADKAAVTSSSLSHGDQKLLDIALALALEPRVLLLDEPTAGMGPEERWQMIDKVQELWERKKMTLIFIEHDMDIVFKIAQTIRVLCYGRVLAEGTPDEIRGHPEVIAAYLGTSQDSRDS